MVCCGKPTSERAIFSAMSYLRLRLRCHRRQIQPCEPHSAAPLQELSSSPRWTQSSCQLDRHWQGIASGAAPAAQGAFTRRPLVVLNHSCLAFCTFLSSRLHCCTSYCWQTPFQMDSTIRPRRSD